MPYNEQKFLDLVEDATNKNAVVVSLADKRRSAKARLNVLEIEVSNAPRGKIAPALQAELRNARNDHESLVRAEERAAQAWHEVGAIVSKCKAFLSLKGATVPGATRTTQDGDRL